MKFTSLAAPFLVLLAMASPGHAGGASISTEAIVEALSGTNGGQQGLTRSLAVQERGAKRLNGHQVDMLRRYDQAGSDHLTAEIVSESMTLLSRLRLTAIDLPIEFEFGSATPSEHGYRQLNALGTALTSDTLATASFILAGHTDAAGSEAANRRLSKRRADAVRSYLLKVHRIGPGRLISLGFGKVLPKKRDDPLAPVNRRVEVQAYIPG